MRKGFTLAEILLVISIIGFVAVITLPGVIKNYKARAYTEHFGVFTKRLSEASRQMGVHNDLGPYKDTDEFVAVFKKYIKTEKICDSKNLNGCFSNDVTFGDEIIEVDKLSTSKNFGKDYVTSNVGIRFIDGLTGILSYNPECSVLDIYSSKNQDPSNCLSYLLDLNGLEKPNKIGKDIMLVGAEIKIDKLETIGIDCYKMYEECTGKPIEVDVADITASDYSGLDRGKYNATDNGAQMSWYLAKKTCEDKGLRLPNATELHSMYIASTKGQIAPFHPTEYWATAWEEGGVYHNCYMGAGNCGRASHTRLNYVRCVK